MAARMRGSLESERGMSNEALLTSSIGSFPKPEYLTKARTAFQQGKIGEPELKAVEERATRETIAMRHVSSRSFATPQSRARHPTVRIAAWRCSRPHRAARPTAIAAFGDRRHAISPARHSRVDAASSRARVRKLTAPVLADGELSAAFDLSLRGTA